MKTSILSLLALAVFTLPCCVSTTTYHPDGSKTVVKGVDPNAWVIGGQALNRIPVTPSK